jgi:crossover junction endodeoxyribonuclease RuvC
MRILGIDPGLMITGYGILDTDDDNVKVVEAGVIRTNAKLPLESRLVELGTEMTAIMTQFMPDVVAVEELYSHYGHPRTAIVMGHARGVIFLKAGESGKMVYPYAATRIKKSLTGNGRATKKQVQLMITSTLGLSSIPEPPDAADALAAALCHYRATSDRQAVWV